MIGSMKHSSSFVINSWKKMHSFSVRRVEERSSLESRPDADKFNYGFKTHNKPNTFLRIILHNWTKNKSVCGLYFLSAMLSRLVRADGIVRGTPGADVTSTCIWRRRTLIRFNTSPLRPTIWCNATRDKGKETLKRRQRTLIQEDSRNFIPFWKEAWCTHASNACWVEQAWEFCW